MEALTNTPLSPSANLAQLPTLKISKGRGNEEESDGSVGRLQQENLLL